MLKILLRTLSLFFIVGLMLAKPVFAQEAPTAPPPPLGAKQAQVPESARHMRAIWVDSHWERHKWVQGYYVYYEKYSPRSWVTGHWVYNSHRGPFRGWEWVWGHWQSGRWGGEGMIQPGPGPIRPEPIPPEPYDHHHHRPHPYRPGENGGGLPPVSRPGENGSGLPPGAQQEEQVPGQSAPAPYGSQPGSEPAPGAEAPLGAGNQ